MASRLVLPRRQPAFGPRTGGIENGPGAVEGAGDCLPPRGSISLSASRELVGEATVAFVVCSVSSRCDEMPYRAVVPLEVAPRSREHAKEGLR
jgi:hypothetical protein